MISRNSFCFFIVLLCLTSSLGASGSKQCRVNVKRGMHKESPPIVLSSRNPPRYAYPSSSDYSSLVLRKGESVDVFCPGKTNQNSTVVTGSGVLLVGDNPLKPSQALESAECLGDNKFKVKSKTVSFENISCEEKSHTSYSPIVRQTEEGCGNGERFEIGYELPGNEFLRIMELCHDKRNAATLWARSTIVPANQDQFRFVGHGGRKSFKAGTVFDDIQMSKEEPYNLNVAYQTVDSILKGSGKVDKYLSPKVGDRKFLAKGHLIANADKMYKSEQESTYFYINVVPMWQEINASPGNWYFVEEYVRKLAHEKESELDVWVGGLGVVTLENKEIYLYHKQVPGRKAFDRRIPIPKVLYKCAIDKKSKEAICFLVVNNPYLTKSQIEKSKDKYLACEKSKVCDKLPASRNNPALGYLYCCSLRDFYTSNRKELGLEDLKHYLSFNEMTLLK